MNYDLLFLGLTALIGIGYVMISLKLEKKYDSKKMQLTGSVFFAVIVGIVLGIITHIDGSNNPFSIIEIIVIIVILVVVSLIYNFILIRLREHRLKKK